MKDYVINERIRTRAKEVRLVDSDGQQLGVMDVNQAIEKALEKEMDLILISPSAKPPVCKIGNYGKLKYELTKKEKVARKASRAATLKEFKISTKIDRHDLDVRIKKTKEFLQKRHKVKITVFFRGREVTHSEIGRNLLGTIMQNVAEEGAAEESPKLEGKNMFIVLAPK